MSSTKKKVTTVVKPDKLPTGYAKTDTGLIVLYKRLREEEPFFPPQRMKDHAAGVDFACARAVSIHPNSRAMLPFNLAVAIPDGYFGFLLPRSSALHVKGIVIVPGVIDADFRGEVQAMAYNPTGRTSTIHEGDRIAQLILLPRIFADFDSGELPEVADGRGVEGFGSTGGYSPAEG